MIYLRLLWDLIVNYWDKLPKWNKYLYIALAIIAFIGIGVGFGMWLGSLNKPDIVERERIVEKIKVEIQEKIVEKERIVEKKVYVQDKSVHKVTETKETPDGTKITKVTEDTGTHTGINTDTQKDSEKIKEVEVIKYVDRIVEKEKQITYNKPNWRVGLLAGVDVGAMVGSRKLLITEPYYITLGIKAERRIAGPIYMGVFGLTSGEAGISISGSF